MSSMNAGLYVATDTAGSESSTTVSGSHSVMAESVSFTEGGAGLNRRPIITPYLDRVVPVAPHAKWWNIGINAEVKAQVDEDTPGELSALWRASGMIEDIVSSTSVTYKWSDDPNSAASHTDSEGPRTCTVLLERTADGKNRKAYGCHFGWELSGSASGRLMATFNGLGAYVTPADQGTPLTPTHNAGVPFVALDVTGNNPFRFNAVSPIVEDFTLRSGVSVASRLHMSNNTDNYTKIPPLITRNATDAVSGEFTIEEVDETAWPIWARWEAATAFSGQIIYLAGSRKLTITLRNVVLSRPTDIDGAPLKNRIAFTAHRSGTDGSCDLAFT